MVRSTCGRGLCALAVLGGLATTGWAQEKKDVPKGKEDPKVIVIQLDASKVPPELLKQLMQLAKDQGGGKGEKKTENPDGKKGEDKPKGKPDGSEKGGPQKPNLVQVDINKLSPGLAKQLMAELAEIKAKDAGKGGKGDGDKKGEPKEKDSKEGEKKPEPKK